MSEFWCHSDDLVKGSPLLSAPDLLDGRARVRRGGDRCFLLAGAGQQQLDSNARDSQREAACRPAASNGQRSAILREPVLEILVTVPMLSTKMIK